MEKKAKEFLEELASTSQRPCHESWFRHSDQESRASTSISPLQASESTVVCTLKVPPRLTDRAGNLAKGAIANLVDIVTGCVAYIQGLPMNVSVDISISYMSTAKLDDELEITSKMLGQRGAYSGTIGLLRNKTTEEIIAEGRHSMFRPQFAPKL